MGCEVPLFASVCVDPWLVEGRVHSRLIVNFRKSFFAMGIVPT
jgi:hypothetical protein